MSSSDRPFVRILRGLAAASEPPLLTVTREQLQRKYADLEAWRKGRGWFGGDGVAVGSDGLSQQGERLFVALQAVVLDAFLEEDGPARRARPWPLPMVRLLRSSSCEEGEELQEQNQDEDVLDNPAPVGELAKNLLNIDDFFVQDVVGGNTQNPFYPTDDEALGKAAVNRQARLGGDVVCITGHVCV